MRTSGNVNNFSGNIDNTVIVMFFTLNERLAIHGGVVKFSAHIEWMF